MFHVRAYPPKPMTVYVVADAAFVPHPLIEGAWMRVHVAVARAACPYAECKSAIGVPCRGKRSYTNGAHMRRKDLADKPPLPRGMSITIEHPAELAPAPDGKANELR